MRRYSAYGRCNWSTPSAYSSREMSSLDHFRMTVSRSRQTSSRPALLVSTQSLPSAWMNLQMRSRSSLKSGSDSARCARTRLSPCLSMVSKPATLYEETKRLRRGGSGILCCVGGRGGAAQVKAGCLCCGGVLIHRMESYTRVWQFPVREMLLGAVAIGFEGEIHLYCLSISSTAHYIDVNSSLPLSPEVHRRKYTDLIYMHTTPSTYTTTNPNSHPSHDKKRPHTGGCVFICMYVVLACKNDIYKCEPNHTL